LRRRSSEVHCRQSSPPFGSPRTGGAYSWVPWATFVSGAKPQRVVVFLDFQNVYHRARDAFCARDAASREGQVDPLALGHLLAGRVLGRRLAGVRVYRGRPSQRRDARSYAAHQRQTDRQVSRGDGLVTVVSRDLRYPPDWPRRAAQEKGIDVPLAVDFVVMLANRVCDVGIRRAKWLRGRCQGYDPDRSRCVPCVSVAVCSQKSSTDQSWISRTTRDLREHRRVTRHPRPRVVPMPGRFDATCSICGTPMLPT
jgi:hypothetical protein